MWSSESYSILTSINKKYSEEVSTNAFRVVSKDPYQQVLNFSRRQLDKMPVLQAKNRFVKCEKALYKEVLEGKYCVYQCISMSKLEKSSVVSNCWLNAHDYPEYCQVV